MEGRAQTQRLKLALTFGRSFPYIDSILFMRVKFRWLRGKNYATVEIHLFSQIHGQEKLIRYYLYPVNKCCQTGRRGIAIEIYSKLSLVSIRMMLLLFQVVRQWMAPLCLSEFYHFLTKWQRIRYYSLVVRTVLSLLMYLL